MPGPTRSTTRYAAGLVAAVALAGCGTGGDAPAAQTPTATSSAAASTSAVTPSATPSSAADPVLARIPAAARPETMEGAEAFAQFFFAQVNKSWSAPEAAAMDQLFLTTCKTCTAFFESAKRMESEGRRHKGDTLTVTGVSTIGFVNPTKEVRVDVNQNAVPVLNRAGERIDTTTAAKGSFVVTLTFTDHWIVNRLQAVKS